MMAARSVLATDQGGAVRAFISVHKSFGIHMEGMTRASETAQPWNRGACRRR
jgi:hypothetical protein